MKKYGKIKRRQGCMILFLIYLLPPPTTTIIIVINKTLVYLSCRDNCRTSIPKLMRA